MPDPSSRYANAPTRILQQKRGDETLSIPYLARRVLPQPSAFTIVSTVTPKASERVDLLSVRALGSPMLYWRLCDANSAMNPRELEDPEKTVRVPAPGR